MSAWETTGVDMRIIPREVLYMSWNGSSDFLYGGAEGFLTRGSEPSGILIYIEEFSE
jgi:hypothetical protein